MPNDPPTPKSFLHYSLERVDYTVSENELETLRRCGESYWKDFGLACVAVAIPCALNALSIFARADKPYAPNVAFVLNVIIASVSLVCGAAFIVRWLADKEDVDKLVKRIKDKPKLEIKTEAFTW